MSSWIKKFFRFFVRESKELIEKRIKEEIVSYIDEEIIEGRNDKGRLKKDVLDKIKTEEDIAEEVLKIKIKIDILQIIRRRIVGSVLLIG